MLGSTRSCLEGEAGDCLELGAGGEGRRVLSKTLQTSDEE